MNTILYATVIHELVGLYLQTCQQFTSLGVLTRHYDIPLDRVKLYGRGHVCQYERVYTCVVFSYGTSNVCQHERVYTLLFSFGTSNVCQHERAYTCVVFLWNL